VAGATVETVAKALNITPRRVQQLVHEGMPKGARGEYDLGACMVWYIRYLQAALERASPNGTGAAAEERGRLNRAQAEKAELELQARRGEVVDRKRMEAAMAAVLVTVRESLLAIPDRLAAALTGVMDEGKVRKAIDIEVRNSLESLVVTMGDDGKGTRAKH
jgi:phage terminase Nu1 subunit (DNA packaging protein)